MGTETLPVVARLIQEVNAGGTLREIVDILFDRLDGILPYDRIAVATVDRKDDHLKLIAAHSRGPVHLGPGYKELLGGSSLEKVIRRGEPRILNDLEKYFRNKPESKSTQLILKEGMRSSLTVPLTLRGRPFGAVFFSSIGKDAYSDEHVSIVSTLADFLACVIEKSNLTEEVRRKNNLINLMFDHSPVAMGIVDAAGLIRSWNPAAEQVFGYTSEDVLGQPYSLLMPKQQAAPVEEDDEKEQEMVAQGDKRRTVAVTSRAIITPEGRSIGHAMIWRDLSALRKLKSDLLSAQVLASVGELAAAVAHEVKNPLAGISGAMQILKDAVPRNDSRAEMIEEVLRQVARLDRLIRELLTFARPWTPQLANHDLGSLAFNAVKAVRHDPRASGHSIQVERKAPCPVRVDRELVEMGLSNILYNAIEAIPDGGKILVSCAPLPRGGGGIRIEDDGPGIPPKTLQSIFKPFYTTKSKGTGLGLSIVKRVVDSHHGSIEVTSQAGKGACVVIEFPNEGEKHGER